MKELQAWKDKAERLLKRLAKYKYVLLVVLAGVILLLLPTGNKKTPQASPAASAVADFDLEAMERQLSEAISKIDGAGEATVMLTLRGGTRQILAQDIKHSDMENASSTVVVSKGSGVEDAVVVQKLCPQFQGALVVCPGGGKAEIQLQVANAVSALTGLGVDKISICRGK